MTVVFYSRLYILDGTWELDLDLDLAYLVGIFQYGSERMNSTNSSWLKKDTIYFLLEAVARALVVVVAWDALQFVCNFKAFPDASMLLRIPIVTC